MITSVVIKGLIVEDKDVVSKDKKKYEDL